MKQFIDLYNKRVPVYNKYVATHYTEYLAYLSDDEIEDLSAELSEADIQYFLTHNVMFILDGNCELECWIDLDSYIKNATK